MVHEKPPLPNEDEPEQKRARLDDSNLTDKPTENNQVEDEVSYIWFVISRVFFINYLFLGIFSNIEE